MKEDDDKYRVYLEAQPEQDLRGPRPVEDLPFCLGILGDFSGRGTRAALAGGADWASRPLVRVTPENVLNFGGLSPKAEVRGLPGTAPTASLVFEEMDDFHPDSLFRRLDLFRDFRLARERILGGEGPAGLEGTGAEDGSTGTVSGEGAGQGAESAAPGLLDAILQETNQEALQDRSDLEGDLDGFIRRVVRPHLVQPQPDRTAELEALDREASLLMRAVLHSPGLRALESLWRSVVFLLSQVETSSKLRVYLVDVSWEELASDLLSTDEPTEWNLARTLLSPVSDKGEELRWAALLGAYEFGKDPDDIALLQRIALLAEVADIPWISAGDPALAGCRSLVDTPHPRDWNEAVDDLWDPFRSSPEAGWIGLATPGFLLRTPYGPRPSKTNIFTFHEASSRSSDCLWGNPALLWGVLHARAFSRSGWDLRLNGRLAVDDMPLFVNPEGWGQSVESVLSHSAALRMGECGLMPLVSPRDEPMVRFFRMGSISKDGGSVGAWWRDNG